MPEDVNGIPVPVDGDPTDLPGIFQAFAEAVVEVAGDSGAEAGAEAAVGYSSSLDAVKMKTVLDGDNTFTTGLQASIGDKVAEDITDDASDIGQAAAGKFVTPWWVDLDPGVKVAPLTYLNPLDFKARGEYGSGTFDDTAAFQATGDRLFDEGGGVLEVPPGYRFRVEQFELKEGVVIGGSLPMIGGVSAARPGSKIIQAEGSSVDMIIGTGFTDPGGGHYLNACGIRNVALYGNGPASTSAKSAFAAKDASGQALNWQHGCFIDNVIIMGFQEDGIWIPGGSGVQNISHVTGYMNGGFLINIDGAYGNVQHVHLVDISGDGHTGGAAIRIAGQGAGYQTLIDGLKSEQLINFLIDPVTTPGGSVVSQPNALLLHNCESAVEVKGLQHIAGIVWSVVGGTVDATNWTVTGGTKTKPGEPIKITNSGNLKRPTVRYSGRVRASEPGQTGGSDPGWVRDATDGRNVVVPFDHDAGTFGGKTADTMGARRQTPGKYREVIGLEGTSPVPSALDHSLNIRGATAAGVEMYVAGAAANIKSFVLKNTGDGRVVLRNHDDATAATLMDLFTFKTDGSGQITGAGIRGLSPAPPIYTQTYTTATRTVNAYTTDTESVAYTGTPADAASTAKLADLNALRVAYENLRASHDNLLQVVTNIIDDFQANGWLR